MKKFILVFTLFLAIQLNGFSQETTRIGGLLGYATEFKTLGIGINAEFPIFNKLTIAPSFVFYLPKDYGGYKVKYFELNANANYYFLQQEKVSVYGLAGLNYSIAKGESINFGGFGTIGGGSYNQIGLNLGGGANFNLGGSITPFAEIKYVIMDLGQLVLAGGVKFNLSK